MKKTEQWTEGVRRNLLCAGIRDRLSWIFGTGKAWVDVCGKVKRLCSFPACASEHYCACAAWASSSSEALHQELGSPSAIPWCFPLSWKKQKGWRLPVCSLLVQSRQWPRAHLSHKSTERSGPYFGFHSPQWPKGDFIAGFHQNVLEGWDTSHWEPGLHVSSNSFISVVPRVAGSRNLSSGSIYTALANATHQSIGAFLFRVILLVFMSSSSHIYNIKQYISYIWYF